MPEEDWRSLKLIQLQAWEVAKAQLKTVLSAEALYRLGKIMDASPLKPEFEAFIDKVDRILNGPS
ncbi:MAG: hypothetical protein ACYC4D_10075 [Thermoleophilia bacterium]